LESVPLYAVLLKAKTCIEVPRLLIVSYHRQLDQLNAVTCKIKDRFDQAPTDTSPSCIRSNVHAPNHTLMSHFLASLDREGGGGDQLLVAEHAEHRRAVEALREPTQRLGVFKLKGAGKRFRVGRERLQSNLPIPDDIGCIGLRQTPYLDVSGAHVSSLVGPGPSRTDGGFPVGKCRRRYFFSVPRSI